MFPMNVEIYFLFELNIEIRNKWGLEMNNEIFNGVGGLVCTIQVR